MQCVAFEINIKVYFTKILVRRYASFWYIVNRCKIVCLDGFRCLTRQ